MPSAVPGCCSFPRFSSPPAPAGSPRRKRPPRARRPRPPGGRRRHRPGRLVGPHRRQRRHRQRQGGPHGQRHPRDPGARHHPLPRAARGQGPFHTLATFTQTKPTKHAEGYGLFYGGQSLDGAAEQYTYFLVRQDGTYLVKRREGDKTTEVTKGWVASSAVHKPDAKGPSTNKLEIDNKSDPSKVVFLVNGEPVYSLDAKATATDGAVGLRVNHNLDLHIDGFDVHRLSGSSARPLAVRLAGFDRRRNGRRLPRLGRGARACRGRRRRGSSPGPRPRPGAAWWSSPAAGPRSGGLRATCASAEQVSTRREAPEHADQ